jgi:hypothetical protein
MTTVLMIAFRENNERPKSVAILEDPELLLQAALLALEQAEQRAAEAARSNPLIGKIQSAEVERLRATLEILVPGFQSPSPVASAVM